LTTTGHRGRRQFRGTCPALTRPGSCATTRVPRTAAEDKRFELFPDLKVIMTEGGIGWIPDITQPLAESRRRDHLHLLCEIARADRTLIFSSDYPHWDFDDPRYALAALPPEIRQRVSAGKAAEAHGERLRPAPTVPARSWTVRAATR
jgi:hypothetical protein